jgi:uncharacterized membrane protein HdeD (DUF308 family)
MADLDKQAPLDSASHEMRTLEAGTASFADAALIVMLSNLAKRVGRPIATDERNSTARGLLGIAAGVAVIVWPDSSLSAAVVVFGVYAVLDGVLSLWGLLIARNRVWQRAAQAVTSLAVGAFAFVQPDVSRTAALYLLALWVIVMGALRLRAALNFGTTVTIRWLPAILSLLAVVPACIVLVTPDRGLKSVMLNIGIFAILHGAALIVSDARAAAARARTKAPVPDL